MGSAEQGLKGHALVIPCPFQGHITPLMHLSRTISRCCGGFLVTFVNTRPNHDALLRNCVETEDKDNIRLEWIPDGLTPEKRGDGESVCRAILDPAGVMVDAFRDLAKRIHPPPTCIIADLYIPFAYDIADMLGVPIVLFWHQSLTSLLCRPRGIIHSKEELDAYHSSILHTIPGIPSTLCLQDLPTFLQTSDPSDFFLFWSTQCMCRLNEAACILLNTFDELEDAAIESFRREYTIQVYSIGPVLPSEIFTGNNNIPLVFRRRCSLQEEEQGCIGWLDQQPQCSVLYVSFGSIAVLKSVKQFGELLAGLEESMQRVLLVARADMAIGKVGSLIDGFAKRNRNRVIVISWAPQLQVLSHISIGGFLSHCGWNSTLEAIACGVPILAWPYFVDQVLNRRLLVSKWGIGLELLEEEDEEEGGFLVKKEEIEKKVNMLMIHNHDALREKVTKLRNAAKLAVMDEKGSSAENLALFISQITSAQN